jgi:PKD repeat protein
VLLVACAFASPSAAAPNASFVATAVQGPVCVAPCAYHFDAIGNGGDRTTDASFPRAFHTLLFHWDFGDPGSGIWAVSGRRRDTALGGIAGHLYEHPGTYTVRLTVTNPYGESDVVESQVVVTDPDSYFPASDTWCFANSGTPGGAGFAACPTTLAARHVVIPATTAGGFDLALSSTYCGASLAKKRCLFRAGDRFLSSSITALSPAAGAGLVARFGDGADPRVTGGPGFLVLRDRWTVFGFDVEFGNGGSPLPLFRAIQQNSNITVAQVRGRNVRSVCFETETGISPGQSDLIAIVGIDCLHANASLAGLYIRAERVLVLGNVIDNAYQGQFVLRTVHFPKSVVAHNALLRPLNNPAGQRNTVQIRAWAANGTGGAQPPPAPTRWVVFADNHIGQDNASVFVRTCQTNDCTDSTQAQDVRDVIFERNFLFFTKQPGGTPSRMARAFWIQGGDVTVRDNVVDAQGIEAGNAPEQDRLVSQGFNMASGPAGLDDDRIHVVNNVVYFDESVQRTFRICESLSAGSGHRCQNNLVHLPNHTGQKYPDDGTPGWQSSNNLIAGASPFGAPIPDQGLSSPTSFKLAAGAAGAVDAGYDFDVLDAGTRLDFGARCRPADGMDADGAAHWDVGAWEQSSDVECLPIAAPEPDASLAGAFALLGLAWRLCHSPRRAEPR